MECPWSSLYPMKESLVCSRQGLGLGFGLVCDPRPHTLIPSCFPQLEEKLVQNSEQQLADLRRRSTSIAPLRLRRTNPNRPITVESLCDWEGEKVTLPPDTKKTSQISGVKLVFSFRVLCLEERS